MPWYWYVIISVIYFNLAYLFAEFNWRIYEKGATNSNWKYFLWPFSASLDNEEEGYFINDFSETGYKLYIILGGFFIKIGWNIFIICLFIFTGIFAICLLIAIQLFYSGGIGLAKIFTWPLRKLLGLDVLDQVTPFKFIWKL